MKKLKDIFRDLFFSKAKKDFENIFIGVNTNAYFASAAQGSEIITASDDYMSRISSFDRQSKMQTNDQVTQEDLVRYMGKNTLEFTNEEKCKLARSAELFERLSRKWSLPLPEKVFFVKTTGREEGGAPYTRANAIFFPEDIISLPQERVDWLVAHELFHVLTRANVNLRDKLYKTIGFEKCGEIELPQNLADKKISNPDAPLYDHVIEVQYNGEDHWAMPIIYSEKEFDASEGKTFFDYLNFRLLLAQKDERLDNSIRKAFNNSAKLVKPEELTGFFEKVGRNTNYIIHPEEVLAENFVHMLLQTENLPNPELIEKISARINEYTMNETETNVSGKSKLTL